MHALLPAVSWYNTFYRPNYDYEVRGAVLIAGVKVKHCHLFYVYM